MYTPIIVKPHTTLKSRECAGHFYNSALAELISVLAALRSAFILPTFPAIPVPCTAVHTLRRHPEALDEFRSL